MSTWREIWKKSIVANSLMSRNEEQGKQQFEKLLSEYKNPKTGEDDGMIHYALAEAYEFRKKYNDAESEYKLAQKFFPVEHWKTVAQKSIERVYEKRVSNRIPDYYKKNDFKQMIWFMFQKVWEFVNLDDFARYICLSAISRADSEWPLSLVDFRSVLELQIKNAFPEIVEEQKNIDNYSLRNIIDELGDKCLIEHEIVDAMHKIRMDGNLAVHELKTLSKNDIPNIENFLKILQFFNNYKKEVQL